ncbi:hypothetical protein [Fischerella thermalis]|uniref:hypothetical protein n=1 Tax=Fischerella thermalis TaxID=372787 RepID=UPI00215502D3|nr:hypothetical protein [Fischerella thermalis]
MHLRHVGNNTKDICSDNKLFIATTGGHGEEVSTIKIFVFFRNFHMLGAILGAGIGKTEFSA